MNIYFVTQYFWPESFRVNDLAVELVKRGHKVTVLAGKPNYPYGKIFDGYKFWGVQKEVYKGVDIIRIPIIPRGNNSGVRLMLNYFSYVVSSCLYILFHSRKYDVTFTFATSPITQVFGALLYKFLFHKKAYIWVQDLWPESVEYAGNINNKLILGILTAMVRSIYNKVDGILIPSKKFAVSINSLGNYSDKLYYVPNWAEDIFLDKVNQSKNKFAHVLPKGFIVLFTGNIGAAQDLDNVLKAARLTVESNPNIHWVFAGAGRRLEESKQQSKEFGIENNIHFIGRFPVEDMPALLSLADVCLVSLKSNEIFANTIPSKIQSYMASGKPIVSMIDGITNDVIKESGCGLCAVAEDYEALASNIVQLSQAPNGELKTMCDNAIKYYNENFQRETIISNIERILQNRYELTIRKEFEAKSPKN